ncbi:hypothetical protein ACLK2C_05785 [Escherichia coli]
MLNLVKAGEADACVSAGNTGALMAMAKCVLKSLPGVHRPALIKALPTLSAPTVMLDLGANVSCDADTLLQFAVMGSVVAEKVGGISPPCCLAQHWRGEIKGGNGSGASQHCCASATRSTISVSSKGIAYSAVDSDVIVCDGFVGNVALKTAEGVVRMMASTADIPARNAVFLAADIYRIQDGRFFLPEPRPV